MVSRARAVFDQTRMSSSVEPNRSHQATPANDASSHRPLPATGLPTTRQSKRVSALVSLLAHLLVLALLIRPIGSHEGEVVARAQGAGGAGPAGGGGGGHNGSGGVREHVDYMRIAPAPSATAATAVTTPVKKERVVPPVVAPPKPVPPPAVLPHPALVPPVAAAAATPAPEASKIAESPIAGVGGGTGRDGSTGNGPGSGGGVGSGIGTGRGSGTGPGTGGGTQANYPPTTVELFIPPLPIPGKVHGFHGIAEFDVDVDGKVLGFTFTPTRDGSYNRLLDDVFKRFKFRPGTTPDGTPIRMKVQIPFDLG
jgi:protein TonB